MPRYVIERSYWMPVYKQFVVEVQDLKTACAEAMDEHKYDWKDQIEDPEASGPHHLTRAVELVPGEDEDLAALYDGKHEPLAIPAEFAEPDNALLAEILERNDCGKDRVLIDGEDLATLRRIAETATLTAAAPLQQSVHIVIRKESGAPSLFLDAFPTRQLAEQAIAEDLPEWPGFTTADYEIKQLDIRQPDFIPFPWPELSPVNDPERLEALARYARVPVGYEWRAATKDAPAGWVR